MPGSPNCFSPSKKCHLFEVDCIYTDFANLSGCKLNSAPREILFNVKGVFQRGGPEWCELLLIEANAGTNSEQLEFADFVQSSPASMQSPITSVQLPPVSVQLSTTAAFNPGYIRLYKRVDSRLTGPPLKVLVRKRGVASGWVSITCKFRHGKVFGDACPWHDHSMTINIEVV